MATTTNYSWTTPDNTAYVKDGASAIRSLGSSVDTSLFSITGGKNVGHQFINSTTFTAASAVQVNNVFTTAYDNYAIVLRYTQNTSTGNLYYQNSLSGTPAATAYGANGFVAYGNGLSTAGFTTGAGGFTGTKINIGNSLASIGNFVSAEINSPALAVATNQWFNFYGRSTGFGANTAAFIGGIHETATAYDGFTLSVDAGTITGTVKIYGLRNS